MQGALVGVDMPKPDISLPSGLAALAAGRDTLPTHEAAHAINRAAQTLRVWACHENGPIRPVRINRRLAWRVTDLAKLLQGGSGDD